MNFVSAVLRGLEVASIVLGLAALPLVGFAVMRRFQGEGLGSAEASPAIRVRMAIVAATSVVALLVALLTGVPLPGLLTFAAIAVLLGVLFAGDDEFWRLTAGLFVLFTVIGLVLLLGLSTSYLDENGYRWYGTRMLMELAGIGANPTRGGGWIVPVASAAVLRFGLPLALAVSTAYQASTRPDVARNVRLGLSLSTGMAITASYGSAGYLLAAFTFGVFAGMPPVLGFAAILGALLIVLLAGPGSIGALLVGGRTLRSLLPGRVDPFLRGAAGMRDLTDVAGGVRSGTSTGEARIGLVQWAFSNVGQTSRIWLKLIGLAAGFSFLAWAGLSGSRLTPDTLSFQPIDTEVKIDFVVDEVHRASQGRAWLLGEDRVAVFDPATKKVVDVDIDGALVVSAPGPNGALVGMTAAQPMVVVRLDERGRRPVELGRLLGAPPGAPTSIAAVGEAVYLTWPDGTIGRWSIAGGEPLMLAKDEPGVELIGVTAAGVWTVRHGVVGPLGDTALGRRDAGTLAPIDLGQVPPAAVDVAMGPDGTVFMLSLLSVFAVSGDSGALAWGSRVETGDAWVVPSADGVWVARPYGEAWFTKQGAKATRRDFHYDSVIGVIDTPGDGTWVVGVNDRGMVVDTVGIDRTIVGRWAGPHDG